MLGQQVSLAGAATLAARLVARHGEPLSGRSAASRTCSPRAARSPAPTPSACRCRRLAGGALLGLARRSPTATSRSTPAPTATRRGAGSLALPGIGPWTVAYIAMRALRDPDAFLATDLGVRHALERLGQDGRPAAARTLAERWRPYRAYALQHLWSSLAG